MTALQQEFDSWPLPLIKGRNRGGFEAFEAIFQTSTNSPS